jgi:hypothetical protein
LAGAAIQLTRNVWVFKRGQDFALLLKPLQRVDACGGRTRQFESDALAKCIVDADTNQTVRIPPRPGSQTSW